MPPAVAGYLNDIDEAIIRHSTDGGAKSDVWLTVQNNITSVNSIIKKTSDIAQAESELHEAALHYTGGQNSTATINRDKAEEDTAFELFEVALGHYREALETAKPSEEAPGTAELSEMAKILRSGQ